MISDVEDAIALFEEGYSLETQVMNWYQIRLFYPGNRKKYFDWYHTTGSLVESTRGPNGSYHKSHNKIKNPEDVALLVKKILKRK